MFHKTKGQFLAIFLLLNVSSQPIITYAAEQSAQVESAAVTVKSRDLSFDQFRRETKAKLSDARMWVKDTSRKNNFGHPIQTLETKIDRLQDRVKPAGRSMRVAIKKRIPGKGLVHRGDRMMSVYGIMLIMAFGVVLFFMSSSSPSSRLGGRH